VPLVLKRQCDQTLDHSGGGGFGGDGDEAVLFRAAGGGRAAAGEAAATVRVHFHRPQRALTPGQVIRTSSLYLVTTAITKPGEHPYQPCVLYGPCGMAEPPPGPGAAVRAPAVAGIEEVVLRPFFARFAIRSSHTICSERVYCDRGHKPAAARSAGGGGVRAGAG
jgi:hypothetical protein